MSTRESLATAASTIDDVNVTPYYRQTTKAGAGFVRLGRVDYPDTFGGLVTWEVIVLLPQDQAQAEQRIEELLPALYAALSPEMALRNVVPTSLVLADNTAVPGLVVTGQREED